MNAHLLRFYLALFSLACNAADLPSVAKAKSQPSTTYVAGDTSPWRFVTHEIVHLSHGDLTQVSDLKSINAKQSDPLPIITQYHQQLKDLGVELILVPVPAKAAIYPEHLSADLAPQLPPLSAFIAKLNAAKIRTLDLPTLFFQHRQNAPDQQLYCATDSHWSPAGAQLAAGQLASVLKDHPALKEATPKIFSLQASETIQIHGDLITDEEKTTHPAESLPLQSVTPDTSGPSPILVIGDSHCQVFRTGGNMLANNAGFIDHLAQQLSLPIEEISSQASGADQPRADIARRSVKEPNFWNSRKIVIWLFTERELTQALWRPVPALVQKK